MTLVTGYFENLDVDTIETLADIPVKGQETLFVSFVVDNSTANLSAFTAAFRVATGAGFFTIASTATDFTVPAGPVLGASGDLTTAAKGTTVHWLRLDVRGVEMVRLEAAGTSSSVVGYFGAQ